MRPTLKPLSRQRRLPIPGRRDEHDDPRLGFVEHLLEAGPPDDVTLRRGGFDFDFQLTFVHLSPTGAAIPLPSVNPLVLESKKG
jgi:hypothetical protein